MTGAVLAQLDTATVAELLVEAALRLAGIALLTCGVAAVVAVVYRWFVRERVVQGVPLLVGLAAVAVYLNASTALGEVVGGELGTFTLRTVVFNLSALAVGAAAAPVGRAVGDRIALDVFAFAGARELDAEVSQLVRAVGRVVAVTLPEDVEDIDGYDPVADETKEALAEHTLVFPRGLTVEELRERLAARLKDDYGVGYVDVELTEDGEVTYLALGARLSGIGPTLAPGTAAVAVRADPPNTASPGDVVQVWERPDGEGDPTRVATGELRATADDVVALALDTPDARQIAGGEYRLVTLPSSARPERAFASLLRAADETMGAVTVDPASELVGRTVGELVGRTVGELVDGVTVAAVRPAEGSVEPIPSRARQVGGGDTLYVVGRPETIRRLELQADAAGGESESRAA